jgi:hypothetical protein
MSFSESNSISIFGTDFVDISFVEKDHVGPHIEYDTGERKVKVVRSDAIQFSHNQRLFIHLRNIQGVVLTRLSPVSSECSQTTYHLPANQSEYFFNTVVSLQKNGAPFFLSKEGLESTFSSLLQRNYLSQQQVNQFQIQTASQDDRDKRILQKYREKVLENAKISITSPFSPREVLSWIVKAKECLGSESLQKEIDIAPFFKQLQIINTIEFFNTFCNDELTEMALQSPNLTRICLQDLSYYTKEKTGNIASFLRKCPKISRLSLNGSPEIPPNGRLSAEMLFPITTALQETCSISSLTISYANLGDDGARLLLSNLISNENLESISLTLIKCDITDSFAQKNEGLIKKKPTLTLCIPRNNRLVETPRKQTLEIANK